MNLFELSASITLDTSDYDKGIDKVDSSAESAKESLNKIGQGASSAGGDLSSLGSTSSSTGNELSGMGQESSSASSELGSLGQEASSAGGELSSLGDEASAAGEEASSLGEEAASAGEEESSLGEEAGSAGQELSSLGEEASSAAQEESSLGQESSSAGNELSSMASEAGSAGQELSSLGEEAGSAGSEMSSAGSEASSFGSELASLAGNAASAASSIGDLGDKSESSGSIMKEVLGGNVLTNTITSAWDSITGSIDGAISRVDTLNNYSTVMQNLGYTTEQADEATDKLVEGIDGLPTSLDSIVSWQQTFTALSGDIEESTDLTIALNNATLAGGQGQEKANSAMQAWYNCIAQGKPTATYWREMVNAMPAQMDELSKSMLGDTATSQDLFDAWQGGTVTTEEVEAALVDLNENGYGEMASYAQQAIDANSGIETSMTNVQTAITKGVANVINAYNDWAEDSSFPTISEALDSVKGFVNSTFGAVTEGMPDVLDTFASLAESVGKQLEPVFDTISTVMDEQVMPAFQEVGDFLSGLFSDSLNDTGSTIGDMLTPVIETLANFLTEGILPVFESVASFVMNTVVPAFSEIGTFISEKIMPAFGDMETGITGQISPILESLSGFISETLVPALESIGTWIAEKVMPFISDMASFISENVVPVIMDLAEWITEHIVPAFQAIGDFVMDTVMPALEDLWNIFAESILPVFEAVAGYIMDSLVPMILGIATAIIDTVMPPLKTFSAFFSEHIVPALQSFYDKANEVVQGVMEFFGNLGENISVFVQDVKTFFTVTIPSAFDDAWRTIDGWVADIKNFFTVTIPKAIDDMISFFKNIPTDIKKWLDEVIKRVSEWATDFKNTALSAVTDFVDNVINGVTGLPGKIGEELSKVIQKVTDWTSDLVDGAKGAAGDFIDGLISGFTGGITNIIQAVQGIGESILGAFKGFFGINSPSTVMAEQGAYLIDGTTEGMVDEANSSATASAINSAGNAILDDVDATLNAETMSEKGSGLVSDLTDSMLTQANSSETQNTLDSMAEFLSRDIDSSLEISGGVSALTKEDGEAIFGGITSGTMSALDMYGNDDVFEFVTEYEGKMYSTFQISGGVAKLFDGVGIAITNGTLEGMTTSINGEEAVKAFNDAEASAEGSIKNSWDISNGFSEVAGNIGETLGHSETESYEESMDDATSEGAIDRGAEKALNQINRGAGMNTWGAISSYTTDTGRGLASGEASGYEDAMDSAEVEGPISRGSEKMLEKIADGLGFTNDREVSEIETKTGRGLSTSLATGYEEGSTDSSVTSEIDKADEAIVDEIEEGLGISASSDYSEITNKDGRQLSRGLANGAEEEAKSTDTRNAFQIIGDTIVGWIEDVFDMHSPSKVMEGEGELMTEGVVNGFDTLAADVKACFQEMKETVLSWCKSNISAMEETGKEMDLAVVHGLQYLPTDTYNEALKPTASTIENWGSSLSKSMNTYGSNMSTGFSNGMVSGTSGIYSNAQSIRNNIVKYFDISDAMYSAGHNAMTGFNNGMVNNTSTLYNNARTIANNISNTINSALQVHSPSKVTEYTGEMVDEGLAEGMENGLSSIQNAVGDVIDATDISELQSALDTDVMDGAYTISEIGTIEPSESASKNGVLSNIETLLEDYLPALSEMKMVLDSGEMVGALEAKIDSALGKRKTREERYAI